MDFHENRWQTRRLTAKINLGLSQISIKLGESPIIECDTIMQLHLEQNIKLLLVILQTDSRLERWYMRKINY